MAGVLDEGLMLSAPDNPAPNAQRGSHHVPGSTTSFMWLELTGKCQLECVHCYADSGPHGNHGTMTVDDWTRVIEEGVQVGVKTVQFIGGEPTLHSALGELIDHSLSKGLVVEVYSNLVGVRPELWEKFGQERVRLATSYYSSDDVQHERITQRRGSHAKTRANIMEALSRGIPIRVGIVGIESSQDVESAKAELVALGVAEDNIGIDYLREVGRGIRHGPADASQLCGKCTDGVVAIRPDGTVSPCVFSRWLSAGNVKNESLAQIIASKLRIQLGHLDEQFEILGVKSASCPPDERGTCGPLCNPENCQPHCPPMVPVCPPKGCPPLDRYCYRGRCKLDPS